MSSIICPFPSQETAITLQGPAGNLEASIIGPSSPNLRNAVGIVCHPHPLYGGTMNNKVVTTVAKVFRELGLNTVRFNYRGIGKSEGHYGEGIGEVEDLLAVINWLKNSCKNHSIWLAGFSFGSCVAATVATKIAVEKLVLVAPPIKYPHFPDLTQVHCPQIVVQGGQDEIVSADEVLNWVKNQKKPPQLIYFPEATHFFHGQLQQLRDELMKALGSGNGE